MFKFKARNANDGITQHKGDTPRVDPKKKGDTPRVDPKKRK